jgi:alkanesulfonate monooxygenase SsuD/methylene tetrahydromethanopterin reductase-like flavin-dependent oxidoreductase (luciferase family)
MTRDGLTRVGLTLPSFVDDVAIPIAVARAAEAAGLDAVFAYDHLFRTARDGSRRPAIECFALLGACAVETRAIALGSLVVRATLRPPAVLVASCSTLSRAVGPGRLLVGIGAGDSQSRAENEEFGLAFGTVADRIEALADAVRAVAELGLPVWVGGNSLAVREIVALADGWNSWGTTIDVFTREIDIVRAVAPDAMLTWGGLVVLAADDDAARDKATRLGAGPETLVGSPATVARALRAYVDLGVDWIVLGPVDSRDPANATLAAEVRAQLA